MKTTSAPEAGEDLVEAQKAAQQTEAHRPAQLPAHGTRLGWVTHRPALGGERGR